MKVLGQMQGFATRPYDDDYSLDPQGLVTMGKNVVEAITTYRDSDFNTDIGARLVLRSFAASLSARELGRVLVYTQSMNTTDPPAPDDSLPYPTNGYSRVNLVKLDDKRLLVVWFHGTGTWADTSVDTTYEATAFVVTCAEDGALMRGPFTSIDTPAVGGDTFNSNLYGYAPVATIVDSSTVACFTTAVRADNTVDAICGITLTVAGTDVTAGGWSVWAQTTRGAGVGRPVADGAFAFNGSPYVVTQSAPYGDGSYGPVLYGVTPGGPGFEIGHEWSYFLRADHVGSDVYLLGSGLFQDASTNWQAGIVDKFDGTSLTRLRETMVNIEQRDAGGHVVTYLGGRDWPPPEVDLVSPADTLLIWSSVSDWSIWFGEVSPSGDVPKTVELTPLLAPDWVNNNAGMTATVVGRNAVVERYSSSASGGEMDGAYFLIELVAPARLGRGVQGAHFSG